MTDKKRILMVYTGGTIGMVLGAQGYEPAPGFEARLRERLTADQLDALPSFEVLEMEPAIDSANISPNDWSRMVTLMSDQWSSFDGFVILHGTDTMAYSASAISYLMLGTNKPVVFTGSQVPMVAQGSDAVSNVIMALQAAAESTRHEVMLAFGGKVMRGNRTRKVHTNDFAAFDSPNFPPLTNEVPLVPPQALAFSAPVFTEGTVAYVSFYPGQSSAGCVAVLSDLTIRGVILETYGMGNPPDGNSTIMQALENACKRGLSIVNITQCHRGGVDQLTYATARALENMGIISGRDMTKEAALTKLQVLIAQGKSPFEIKELFATSMVGEVTL